MGGHFFRFCEGAEDLDGASAIVGGGLNWQLDDRNQVNLDYEAQFGSKYDKPWGVNVSFRRRF